MATAKKGQRAAAKIVGECLAGRARIVSREITAIYEAALRPLGATVGQVGLLAVIAVNEPVTPGRVGRALRIEKSTMSRNLERMRTRRWITTDAGPDGRARHLRLTGKGRDLLERALPCWQRAQRAAVRRFGAENLDAIQRIAASATAAG